MLLGGKREVNIVRIEPVGSYAVRLVFDDGHDSGLYSWDVFDELAREHDTNWQRYLQRLDEIGMSRDRDVVKLAALVGHYRRSEEHTSELQSLMRISYAVFCLKKKQNKNKKAYTQICHTM